MKLKNVLPVLAMLGAVFMGGCQKDNDPDPSVAPTMISTDPINNATAIAVNSKISATFSVAMDPSTVTIAQFTLKNGATSVEGTAAYTGTTASFTPSENLAPNTLYTATVTTGAKDVSGISLANDYVWSFTTGEIPDTTLPTVTLTDPANNATDVTHNHLVVTTFSEPMDQSTINSLTFTVKEGSTSVSGAVSYTGSTASFTPSENLAPNTLYTATVTTGAKDVSGISLANDYVWSFTTGEIPDTTLPTVTLTDPANNATDVTLNHLVVTTFSEPMDQSTINSLTFTVKEGSTSVSGAVSYTGSMATFTPASNLLPNTIYTGTITTGAKDMAGNALASNHTVSFTTGSAPDIALPMVNSTDPINLATGVAFNTVISATFNEVMDPLTITSSSFTLTQGGNPVSGTVAYSGTTGTFTPSTILAVSTAYTATITTEAKDLAGNALASNHTVSFTTGSAPDIALPMVNSTDPINLATGVAFNTVISATFNEVMDPLTITSSSFTLTQGGNPVSGTVAYSGTTGTFTPSTILAVSTAYTATITTGAKDLAGNALAANTVWSFTTGGTAPSLAVVNLGAAGNYVILAKSAITNIATSAVTGDLGLSPAATSYITGFALTNATGYATASQVTGKIYAADMASPTPINLTTAVNNMLTAYTDAAGRPTPDFLALGNGNIGGKTLAPGLYKWTNTVTLPSNVTISGGANDVWIFQIAGDLTVSNAVIITLAGGAQAKNIFWQVAGTVALGTTSHFEGVILSKTGITFKTGASFNGRALAQTAVILDKNVVVAPQ